MTRPFLFSKKFRLSTFSDFSFVFQKPCKIIRTPQVVVFSRLNSLKNPRIGLIVSKKKIKKAHDRNRIKRTIRESFRIQKNNLISMDFIVVAKKSDNFSIRFFEKLTKIWFQYFYIS